MNDVTVIGFLPRGETSLGEAWSALDAAAENAGGTSLRHWRGGDRARYAVFHGLDSPEAFASTLAGVEIEIVGRGYVRAAIADLPGAVEHDLGLTGPVSYGEVVLCRCGGMDGHHAPGCAFWG
jgi:hypothetical protein